MRSRGRGRDGFTVRVDTTRTGGDGGGVGGGGNSDTFPSYLFPLPLLAATAFPHPKSHPYMSNRGELLTNTPLASNSLNADTDGAAAERRQ